MNMSEFYLAQGSGSVQLLCPCFCYYHHALRGPGRSRRSMTGYVMTLKLGINLQVSGKKTTILCMKLGTEERIVCEGG